MCSRLQVPCRSLPVPDPCLKSLIFFFWLPVVHGLQKPWERRLTKDGTYATIVSRFLSLLQVGRCCSWSNVCAEAVFCQIYSPMPHLPPHIQLHQVHLHNSFTRWLTAERLPALHAPYKHSLSPDVHPPNHPSTPTPRPSTSNGLE